MQAEWAESLSRVPFESALKAVRNIRDSARPDPPTPGEVWRAAQEIYDANQRAQAVRQVPFSGPAPTPEPTEEERKRNLAVFREMIEKLGRKLEGTHHNERANEEARARN